LIAGAILNIASCSIKGNVCPAPHFYAESGSSITLSDCCYDNQSTFGSVIFGSVSPFEHPLMHLSLSECEAQSLATSAVDSLFRTGKNCCAVPGFHFLASVLLLRLCDRFQSTISLRCPFIFNFKFSVPTSSAEVALLMSLFGKCSSPLCNACSDTSWSCLGRTEDQPRLI
jgi:hypothetical protein